MDAALRDEQLHDEEKLSVAPASFALAGVILILGLCDLRILFTSY